MTMDCQQQKQQQQSTGRRVAFEPMVNVHEELHLNDYTDKEIETTWYTENDLQETMSDVKETLDLIRFGELDEDTNLHCRRGLEPRYKNVYQRKANRLNSHRVVLNVQKLSKNGKCDAGMISRVYSQHTQQPSQDARILGLKDERESLSLFDSWFDNILSLESMFLTYNNKNQHETIKVGPESIKRSHQLHSTAA